MECTKVKISTRSQLPYFKYSSLTLCVISISSPPFWGGAIVTNQTVLNLFLIVCFYTNNCCYISLPLFEINIRFKIDLSLEEIMEDDEECCVSKVGFQLFRAIQAESFWEVIFLPRFLIPFEISLFPLNSGERTLSGWIFQHIHILSAT